MKVLTPEQLKEHNEGILARRKVQEVSESKKEEKKEGGWETLVQDFLENVSAKQTPGILDGLKSVQMDSKKAIERLDLIQEQVDNVVEAQQETLESMQSDLATLGEEKAEKEHTHTINDIEHLKEELTSIKEDLSTKTSLSQSDIDIVKRELSEKIDSIEIKEVETVSLEGLVKEEDVYTKKEVYNKTETYTQAEVDNLIRAGISFRSNQGTGAVSEIRDTETATTSTRSSTKIAQAIAAGGGGGGSTTFLALTDTPSTYAGSALKVVRVNAGATALEFVTLAGGGDALTTNPLSQFASTTSTQLAGVMSDETGSGSLVFATSPTLVTPTLGVASATSVTITGSSGAGFVKLATQNPSPSAVPGNGILHTDAFGNMAWMSPSAVTSAMASYSSSLLTADRTFTLPNADGTLVLMNQLVGEISFRLDGGGVVPTTGAKKFYTRVAYNCTITGRDIVSDVSGSIVFDIWKDSYANFPPTVADTITASAKPSLTSQQKNTSSTLTGRTTTLTAGDYLEINVDSVSTLTLAILTLKVVRT